MKLHRLSVTNYRGIAHRDITFPDRGVVVVSGANEIGKTSMIEALDLLRPIYQKTAAYGHFGRELPEFTWERTGRVDALRAAV